MKIIAITTSIILTIMLTNFFSSKKQPSSNLPSIYNISINNINGEKINFSDYKGKKILIVNTASECGFTGQYADLQQLQETYKDKLVIVGVPCNQFGGQEPGTLVEIKSFCEVNYGVTFILTEKVDVKGNEAHPLYKWLTNKDENGVKSSSVKWNFQKYLLDEEGHFIDYFYSMTKPMSSKITQYLE
jgi:glutathione peroxidase